MAQPVPSFPYAQLELVYPDDSAAAKARFETLAAAFTAEFGAPPQFFVRSPGARCTVCGAAFPRR